MNADELKALSDITFFDNDKGLINPAEHRRFNNETINFVQNAYYATFVVDSDEKLAIWAQNTMGHDYTHVLIKSGNYSSPTSIKLNESGTKTVMGMGGNLLNFTSSAGMIATGGLENDSFIMGVNIQVSGAPAIGFQGCCNLIRCTATISAESSNNAAFIYCNFISHCSGFSTGASSGTAYVYRYCSYLTNCYAKSNVTTNNDSHNFFDCTTLTNCVSFANSAAAASGFKSCDNLTSCEGTATGGGSGKSAGFSLCKKLVGCRGSGNNTGTGEGYGFETCQNMLMCSPDNTCKTGVYRACYMLDEKYAVGETAEGGYNLLTE